MRALKKIFVVLFGSLAACVFVLAGLLFIAVILSYPKLPALDTLTDYRPKIPLRIYSADGFLISEFGSERRSFVRIGDVPDLLKQAILAAEDNHFYRHGGVDYASVGRAILSNLTGGVRSGASTITMQVARNFFLSPDRTFSRKFNEVLLAYKIEKTLTKDQILELYFNQIYLGQRAYGFAAAAKTYFGKSLNELDIAEASMLAGLPKAPSAYNPVVNPDRAKQRQLYVIGRMTHLGFITQKQAKQARETPLQVVQGQSDIGIPAQYVAEMVRDEMVKRYGQETAYHAGFRVYTTVNSQDQRIAFQAVRQRLLEIATEGFGYRGPEGFIDLKSLGQDWEEVVDERLSAIRDSGDMQPAMVTSIGQGNRSIKAYVRDGRIIEVKKEGLQTAKKYLGKRASASKRIRPGSIVRIVERKKGTWHITQMPEVQGALVSIQAKTGAIRALVGGFDFSSSPFNRAIQSKRQPGSVFKPFIYSAGLDQGLTTATIINDSPIFFRTNSGKIWAPKNSDGRFYGPMPVRRALALSRNMPTIRTILAITPEFTQGYIQQFGFLAKDHPPYPTMALGAGAASPLEVAEAYAIFANGGYRVRAYIIDRIEDIQGKVIAKTEPKVAGETANLAIDPRNAFIMDDLLKEPILSGTARRVASLKRSDLRGKTGTTNDGVDAWFAGYNPELVAVTWVGFDKPRTLGKFGYGGIAALPMWMNYMGGVLGGTPIIADDPPPEGIIKQDGEFFMKEYVQTNPELNIESGLLPEPISDEAYAQSEQNGEISEQYTEDIGIWQDANVTVIPAPGQRPFPPQEREQPIHPNPRDLLNDSIPSQTERDTTPVSPQLLDFDNETSPDDQKESDPILEVPAEVQPPPNTELDDELPLDLEA